MLGTIYIEKGYHSDGIELMEKGLEICPWNKNWQQDLMLALKISGQDERKKELELKYKIKTNQNEENKNELKTYTILNFETVQKKNTRKTEFQTVLSEIKKCYRSKESDF